MTAALVAAASLTAAVGCGAGGDDTVTVERIAIVAPGSAHDRGWSEQGISAARTVAEELSVTPEVTADAGDGDVSQQLARAAEPATLTIAHGRSYAAAAAAAARRDGDPVLVFGARDRLAPDEVGDVEVASEQGGYLAGYIAARASFVRSVGVVVAADDPYWYRTAGGFIAGARKFDPKVRIRYTRVGGDLDDDVAASQAAAKRQIVAGTQMVLGLGDASTLGVMRATKDALDGRGEDRFDAMFVDVVGDKADSGHRSITGLTAVIWSFEPAYRQAVRDLEAGTFGRRPYTLDLANGGVSVIANGRTPTDNFEAAMKLRRAIERGTIKVPVTTTDAAVRQLLREG